MLLMSSSCACSWNHSSLATRAWPPHLVVLHTTATQHCGVRCTLQDQLQVSGCTRHRKQRVTNNNPVGCAHLRLLNVFDFMSSNIEGMEPLAQKSSPNSSSARSGIEPTTLDPLGRALIHRRSLQPEPSARHTACHNSHMASLCMLCLPYARHHQ